MKTFAFVILLAAQISFAEIASVATNPALPKTGSALEFHISIPVQLIPANTDLVLIAHLGNMPLDLKCDQASGQWNSLPVYPSEAGLVTLNLQVMGRNHTVSVSLEAELNRVTQDQIKAKTELKNATLPSEITKLEQEIDADQEQIGQIDSELQALLSKIENDQFQFTITN